MGQSPSPRQRAHHRAGAARVGGRDDEEKGANGAGVPCDRRFRRVPFRVHGRVTQLANTQATAEQRDCDRGEKRQISACLSF